MTEIKAETETEVKRLNEAFELQDSVRVCMAAIEDYGYGRLRKQIFCCV